MGAYRVQYSYADSVSWHGDFVNLSDMHQVQSLLRPRTRTALVHCVLFGDIRRNETTLKQAHAPLYR